MPGEKSRINLGTIGVERKQRYVQNGWKVCWLGGSDGKHWKRTNVAAFREAEQLKQPVQRLLLPRQQAVFNERLALHNTKHRHQGGNSYILYL